MVHDSRMINFFCLGLPFLLLAMLEMVRLVPWPFTSLNLMMPWFTAVGICHLGLHTPSRAPYSGLFLLGMFSDALMQMPLGGTSLSFMLCKSIVGSQRQLLLANSFWLQWLMVGVYLAGIVLFQWLVLSLYHGRVVSFSWGIWLGSFVSYPAVHIMLSRVQERLR